MTDTSEIEKEYLSSLSDLNVNSKPLISMLTMLAEENIEHAQVIVDVIVKHITKIPPDVKLPVLYLIDSIVKNLGNRYDNRYLTLFSHSIVNIFCDVFQEVNEKIRAKMFALRQTWNDIFPQAKLYALDIKTNALDPGWPITAKYTPAIHVNPNFFKSKTPDNDILRDKQRELLELQKRKLELELAATKKHIAEQEKQLQAKAAVVPTVSTTVPQAEICSQPMPAESSTSFANSQYQSIDMVQPKIDSLAQKACIETRNAEPAHQNVRPRDPRLARQMQLQNSAQRNFNQRNRTASPAFGGQGFVPASTNFVANSQLDNQSVNRPPVAFTASAMKDAGRKSRTASKNRGSTKDVKIRSTSKTSPKSQKSNSEKPSPKSPSSKSSSKGSKTSPSGSRQSAKDQRKDRHKEKESDTKQSPNRSAAIALAEAERRIREFTIPKKRSPSPTTKDKATKSITDPKVSSTTKTADSQTKSKASKTGSKSRNHVKNNAEIVQHETSPSTTSATTASPLTATSITTSESIEAPIPPILPSIEPAVNVPPASANCVPFTGVGESESFKKNVLDVPSKDIDLRVMLSNTGSSPISTTSFGSSISATPSSTEARKRSEERIVEEERPEQKKRKTEKIDVLFGKEDVDLRTQLSQAITPLFPPAVIPPGEEKPDWATIKADTPKANKSNFDTVRAKFAEATRHLPNKPNRNNDIDLRRRNVRDFIEDSQDGSDATFKIILAQARVKLDNDDMNLEQYNNLMQQVAQAHSKSKKESLKRRNDLANRTNSSMDNNEHFSSSSSDSNVAKSSRHTAKRDRRDNDGPDRNNVSSKENRSNRNHRSRRSKWSPVQSSRDKSQMFNFQQQQQQQLPNLPNQFNVWQGEQQMFPPNIGLASNMMVNSPYMINAIQPNLPGIANQRTINIDGIPRDIRFYDEVTIAFMKENGGEPMEIGFHSGERLILVDNKDRIVLAFNDSYKPFKIDGVTYRIRFGSPLRELYIDDMWYECFFGDPPTNITLDGRVRQFQIEGPSPQLRIGSLRTDLVVGKIDLYVDVHVKVSLYLDAQVQHFEMDNQKHTVQFADYFLTVLIDGEQFGVEYGGMPKKIKFGGRDHYIRFSIMPDGVVPGMVYIRNMLRTERHRGIQSPLPPMYADLAIPVNNVNVVPAIVAPPVAPILPPSLVNEIPSTSSAPVPAVPSINIDDLFQKLLASGILNNTAKPETKEKAKERPKAISLSRPETIKLRQQSHIHVLFSGMQCSSCGVRFPPEQTIKYSQHLDWHFRQNRRDRDSTRRAHSRRWYYNVEDWIQYEEIEDLDERERNWFETQQMEMDMANDDSAQRNESPVPSCVAGPEDVDKTCDMCHDQFETFYNEENEEWHLRNAIRVDEKTYHPTCYEDACKTSVTMDESGLKDELHDDNAVELQLKTESTDESVDRILLDDDDDVIVLPQEEPVITEIADDDDTPTVSSSVPIVAKPMDSTSEDGASTSGVVTSSTNDDANATYESIGNESDVQILVPQISVVDVEEFEEKPIDSTTQLPVVKIKEEPKDDGYDEDDGFEDIGTFEEATIIEDNSVDGYSAPVAIISTTLIPQPAPSTHQTQASMITSLDGNVQLQDAAPPTIGINKIKINITKNVTKTAIKASDSNLGKQSELAASSKDAAASGGDTNKEEKEITFDYKDTMKGVNFKKLPAVRSGTETSGLCTIM